MELKQTAMCTDSELRKKIKWMCHNWLLHLYLQCEQHAYAASTHVAYLISLLSPLVFLCPFAPYNAVFCIESAVVSSAHNPLGWTHTVETLVSRKNNL